MKITTVLFLILIFFTTCTDDVSHNEVTGIGIIEKITGSYYMYGTHELKVDGVTLNALKSESINLDNYLNKKVKITGTLIPDYSIESGPEYIEVKSINEIK